jgi:peptidoglycan/xylan/chitin deacetylase (PgdA/CDA1 family)
MRAAGATGTFFLSGASLERPFAFWYERLQRARDEGVPGLSAIVAGRDGVTQPSGIHELGLLVEQMSPDDRDAVARRLGDALGPDPPDSGLRAESVRSLADGGMTVGFHTLRHDSLAWLPDDRLEAAMTDGREPLEAAAGGRVTTIGYPHGRGDERVAAAARRAGFVAGFTTRHVAVTPATDPFLQGRIGPSLRSVGAMAVLVAWALLRSGSGRSTQARAPGAS